ncbi:MAG: hypothetical protein ACJ757_04545 [Gaiellaceae bacterium]
MVVRTARHVTCGFHEGNVAADRKSPATVLPDARAMVHDVRIPMHAPDQRKKRDHARGRANKRIARGPPGTRHVHVDRQA